MILSRLLSIRYVLYAVVMLISSVTAMEVTLRVRDSYSGRCHITSDAGPGLINRSWYTHHGLKPLQTRAVRVPGQSGTVAFRTNSLGLRGGEVAIPKPPGVYRIVCLGDDAVLAAAVAENETCCARLESLLQPHSRLRVEVINAGVPRYCPLLSYLQVRHQLLALQADLYLLNFDMSDVADDHRYRRFTQMSESSTPLVCPHPELAAARAPARKGLQDYFLLPQWGATYLGGFWSENLAAMPDRKDIDAPAGRYAWITDDPPDWSIYIRQACGPIAELESLIGQNVRRLVLVTSPVATQVAHGSDQGRTRGNAGEVVHASRRPFQLLSEFAQRQGIPCCDLSLAFQQRGDRETHFLPGNAGFSPAGHELAAQELKAFLLRKVPALSGGGYPPASAWPPHLSQADDVTRQR